MVGGDVVESAIKRKTIMMIRAATKDDLDAAAALLGDRIRRRPRDRPHPIGPKRLKMGEELVR